MLLKARLRYRSKGKSHGVAVQNNLNNSSDHGLTLIECLVAIAVVGVSLAVTAPLILLSVATRTQSQRADQALQIAQAEVDRIRFNVINNDTYTVSAARVAVNSVGDFQNVLPPEAIDDATYSTTVDASTAKGIDVDGDNVPDYAAQIFRTAGSTVGTTPVAFDLGVRVYDANAVNTRTRAELEVEQAQLGLTGGEGQRDKRPLSIIYTSVIKSDTSRSLCDYHNFINSVNGTAVSSPSQCN
ncbi:MAG: prepilin-type N-terminal cleavage/methylation domain-containing protein [Leptolyngbyaceae cyanobacterium]